MISLHMEDWRRRKRHKNKEGLLLAQGESGRETRAELNTALNGLVIHLSLGQSLSCPTRLRSLIELGTAMSVNVGR